MEGRMPIHMLNGVDGWEDKMMAITDAAVKVGNSAVDNISKWKSADRQWEARQRANAHQREMDRLARQSEQDDRNFRNAMLAKEAELARMRANAKPLTLQPYSTPQRVQPQSGQRDKMQMLLIGGGILVAGLVLVMAMKRK